MLLRLGLISLGGILGGWISFFSPPTAWPGGQAVLSRPVNPPVHTPDIDRDWTGLDWTRRSGGEKAVCILDQC